MSFFFFPTQNNNVDWQLTNYNPAFSLSNYCVCDNTIHNISRPLASPTIMDAIYGGAIFMAPTKQFQPSMEMHPLFIQSDESFTSLEEQAEEIVRIILENNGNDDKKRRLPFGGYYDNTSYSIEYTCRQLLKVIESSV